eukprot:scaffold128342_cov40-Tisochrysis_lutea.AAC.1
MGHIEHGVIAQPNTIGAEGRADNTHPPSSLVHEVQDTLDKCWRVGLEVDLGRCLVCRRPVGDHFASCAAQLLCRLGGSGSARCEKRTPSDERRGGGAPA